MRAPSAARNSQPSGTNYSRLVSMTYPNGRVEDYGYNSGIDTTISRISYIADDGGSSAGHVAEYSYLGLSTIVIENEPENNTQLTYVKQTGDTLAGSDGGDQYSGLDRFGRVVDQYWLNTSTSTATDRLQYGYDRDGNVLYELNLVNGAFSELYHANSAASGDNNSAYDPLSRITTFRRGTLTSSGNNGSSLDTITTANLNSTTGVQNTNSWSLDAIGNWNSSAPGGTSESNSFNSKNEETAYGATSPTYDYDGNMITDELGNQYAFNAWNQQCSYIISSTGRVVLHAYYDALGNLVREDSLNGDFYCYYNAQGTSIQESVGGAVYSQEVWGLAYVNDLILRDWNSDGNTGTGSLGKSSSGLEDRQYAQHDKQFSVISLTSRTGSIHERMVYDPYGAVTVLSGSWVYASSGDDGTNYWAYYFQGMRELINGTSNVLITRNRLYDVTLGRWMAQDPAGYVDGANVYQMEVSNSLNRIDPSGRAAVVDPGRGGGSAGGYVHGGLVNGGVSVRTGNLVKDPGGLGNTFPGWIQLEFQQQGPGGSMGSTAECHWLQIITVQYTDSDGHQIDSEEMPPFAQDGLLHNAGVPYLDGDPFSSPLSPWYGGFTQDLQFITGELSIFDKPHPISGLGGYGLHYSFDDYLVCKNCTTGTFEVEKHVAWEYDSQADQYSGISIDNNFANPYLQQPNLNIGDGHAVPNPIEE